MILSIVGGHLAPQTSQESVCVRALTNAFREHGHLVAAVNPIPMEEASHELYVRLAVVLCIHTAYIESVNLKQFLEF